MTRNAYKHISVCIILTSIILACSLSNAQTSATWVGGAGNNYWGNAANWSTGVVPTGEDAAAYLLQGTPEASNNTRGHMSVGTVYLGGGSNSVTLDGFSENITSYIPTIYIQKNGTFKITGTSAGIDAHYIIDGGTLDFATSNNRPMNLRTSNSVLNSGAIKTGALTVGAQAAATPTTTLIQNGGTITINNTADSFIIGGAKAGEMTVKNGTLTAAGKLRIGGTSGGQAGKLNVDGGALSIANDVTLGSTNGGAGEINMTNGTVNFNATAWIGDGGGTGTVNISGGTLSVKGSTTISGTSASISIGKSTNGKINLSGGTLNTSSGIYLGYSTISGNPSAITISETGVANVAGTLRLSANAQLNISGGTLNAQAIYKDGASSTLTFSNGTVMASEINMNPSETLSQTGGTLVSGYNGVGALSITGSYTLGQNATLQPTGKTTVSGTATLNGTIDLSRFSSQYVGTYGETYAFVTAGTLAGSPTYTGLGANWTLNPASASATYTGGQDAWYWRSEGSGNYSAGSNWNVNGVQQSSGPTTASTVYVLDTGSNTVTYDYSAIQAASLTIGNGLGGNAALSRAGDLTIGKSVTINRGGTLTASGGNVYIDSNTNINPGGTLTSSSALWLRNNSTTAVTGTLNVSGVFRVGTGTAGTLTVGDGGTLNSSSALYLATNANGTINQSGGMVNITGANGIQICWGAATGTYNLTDGELKVSGSSPAYIGAGAGKGVLNISGGTANFNSSFKYNSNKSDASLVVGQAVGANNELNIYGGVVNTAHDLFVNNGVINISKNDANELGTGTLNLGSSLLIRNSSTVNLSSGTIDGNQTVRTGFGGMGTFNMTGGNANLNQFVLGDWTSATPVLSVSGGTMNLSGSLLIGYHSNATATISNEAVVNAAGGIKLGEANTGFTSTLNLNGGTVNVSSSGITAGEGTYALNLNGSTLGTYDGQSWASSLNAVLGATPTTFAPSDNASITWSGTLSGNGGLNVSGNGLVVLEGTQTYSGATNVFSGATLDLNSATLANSDIAVQTGGTILGMGSVKSLNLTGGTLEVDLDNWLANPDYEPIIVAGDLTFDETAAIVFSTENLMGLIGTRINFLVNDATALPDLAAIYDFSQAGGAYYWSYGLDGSNFWVQINNSAVPEPSSWALIILGFFGLFYLKSRSHSGAKQPR